MTLFRRAIEVDQFSEKAHLGLAHSLARAGDRPGSLRHLDDFHPASEKRTRPGAVARDRPAPLDAGGRTSVLTRIGPTFPSPFSPYVLP
ncbi:MAG: hypothetical protein ACOC7L_04415 [Acidobacteriota bacterium]